MPTQDELVAQIYELKSQLRTLQKLELGSPVADAELMTASGPVMLSALFGSHSDLALVHNMGRKCPYCTLWADGFSGHLPHILSRTAFVVSSPDAPEVQAKMKMERGWTFDMVQDEKGDFTREMGFLKASEHGPGDAWWPGMTTFHRQSDGTILRINSTVFGPGDDFCLVWPMFDMLRSGAGDWEPSAKPLF